MAKSSKISFACEAFDVESLSNCAINAWSWSKVKKASSFEKYHSSVNSGFFFFICWKAYSKSWLDWRKYVLTKFLSVDISLLGYIILIFLSNQWVWISFKSSRLANCLRKCLTSLSSYSRANNLAQLLLFLLICWIFLALTQIVILPHWGRFYEN